MASILYTALNLIVTALWLLPQQPPSSNYAGAQTCSTCHSSIAKIQAQSRHARTWRPPGKEFPSTYTVELEGQPPLQLPVKMMLGGDRFGLSFILEMKRLGGLRLERPTLIEGRYMHGARSGGRVLSPGLPIETPVSYATAIGRVLSPSFAKRCLGCHGAPAPESQDTGVRCESCHGPGRDHIAAVSRKSSDLAIVHPGRLSSEGFLAICAKCHSGFFPLSDPRPDDLLISNQVTALTNSACYIKSGKKLTCKMCHDAHENASHENPKYERACLSCHSPSVLQAKLCSAKMTTGCADCHMPLVKRTDSFPLMDHWIRVVSRPLPENIRSKVARGAAMAERGEKLEAAKFLEGLLPQGANEPSLFYNLGLAYEDLGRPEDALRSYERALQLEPDMIAAYINRGSIFLAQKNLEAAIDQFRKAIETNPLEVPAHYNLAIALQMKGDTEGVQRELRTVVAIDPRMKRAPQVP